MKHPAKFSDPIIDTLSEVITDHDIKGVALDPFAGTGKVHLLQRRGLRTVGIELEPEWATIHPQTVVGNALYLPFADRSFDAIITSPCMEQGQRILTSDLRWVPAGDIEVGQRVVGFDELPTWKKANGASGRRRFKFATVTRSEPKTRPTLRVVLANGDEILTTAEHPWLARKSKGYDAQTWISSQELTVGALVARQTDTWGTAGTFEQGWTSGLQDGEGTVGLSDLAAPKLVVSQARGPVYDRYVANLEADGFSVNEVDRKKIPNRQVVGNVYVQGGVPGIMKALGFYRPKRLLNNWENLDISTRCIQPEWIEVVAVEAAGDRDIQEIETSSGTYISEGYLMHNCYGNRMADAHEAKDDSHRNTYTHVLGRKLHEDNSGAMQWGDEYRHFHLRAWMEAFRVLKNSRKARMVVNISNHIRRGREIDVTGWHESALAAIGFVPLEVRTVETQRNRDGENGDLRCAHESVLVYAKR